MKRFFSILLSLVMVCVCLAGCGNEDNDDHKGISDLYSLKTDYIGDNSKVSAIVHSQEYEDDVEPQDIEIQSEKEPYSLKINVKVEDEEIGKSDLFRNAVIDFALIGNLEEVRFVNSKNKNLIAHFTREYVDYYLKESDYPRLETIGSSEEDLLDFINKSE